MTSGDFDNDANDPIISKTSFKPAYNAVVKIAGMGSWGCRALGELIKKGLGDIDTIALDLDTVAVQLSEAHHQLTIGWKTARGLGAGGNKDIARLAALDAKQNIQDLLRGTDILFILAGMGGGSGTGAGPVIAEIARDMGILTVAIVTMPFDIERQRRRLQAEEGLQNIDQYADTTVVIDNEKMKSVIRTPYKGSMFDAVTAVIVDITYHGITCLTDVIKRPTLINLPLSDVKAVMSKAGLSFIGYGTSDHDAYAAARTALNSPSISHSLETAKNFIVLVTLGDKGALIDAQQILNLVSEFFDPKSADLLIGVNYDKQKSNWYEVTVIALGKRPSGLSPS